jgi:hypothetical protein
VRKESIVVMLFVSGDIFDGGALRAEGAFLGVFGGSSI